MEHTHIKLSVTLTIMGPVLTAGATSSKWGVDATFFRDWEGNLALPGSLVRGKLREAMQYIESINENLKEKNTEKWFGKESGDNKENALSYQPIPGQIKVNHFVCQKVIDPQLTQSQTRIRIEPETGVVDQGALYIKELPFEAGEETKWEGSVEFFSSADELDGRVKEIKQAFHFITSVGGEKTVGFGRLKNIAFGEDIECGAMEISGEDNTGEGLALTIKPLEPIMIGGIRKTENIFFSEKIIPGTVLKGSFAAGLNRIAGNAGQPNRPIDKTNEPVHKLYRLTCEHFTNLRFLHGKPSSFKYSRLETIPLSGVFYGKKYEDIAFDSEETAYSRGVNPATFQVDWKSSFPEGLPPKYKMPNLDYHPVTRTAIEGKRRVADESKLYSFHMIKPKGSLLFRVGDIIRFDELIQKINDTSDSLSVYIKTQFLQNGKEFLNSHDPSIQFLEEEKKVLIKGLNELLKDADLYKESRFLNKILVALSIGDLKKNHHRMFF